MVKVVKVVTYLTTLPLFQARPPTWLTILTILTTLPRRSFVAVRFKVVKVVKVVTYLTTYPRPWVGRPHHQRLPWRLATIPRSLLARLTVSLLSPAPSASS